MSKRKQPARASLPPDFLRVRGLTLWRPWSLAILAGPKRVENRPRAWNIEGELLALHNGLRWDNDGAGQIRDRMGIDEYEDALGDHPALVEPGHIVGVAKVGKVIDRTVPGWDALLPPSQHQWAAGPYCYTLAKPVILPEPIPWTGQQGLFNIDGEAADLIRAAWLMLRAESMDPDEEETDDRDQA